MTPATGPVRAFGRLRPDGPWVGFEPGPVGYRLVVGSPDGTVHSAASGEPTEIRDGLVAGAVAFYLATLDDPPVELEATQADLGALVGDLVARATDKAWESDATEALDAIDDGLAGDAVALRLQRLLPPGADPLEILRRRAGSRPAER